MQAHDLPNDPLWPRAGEWIVQADAATATANGASAAADLGLLGVPAHRSSITPTSANLTPAAVRAALLRYSTFAASRGVDVSSLRALDFGDVDDPDGNGGEERVRRAARRAGDACSLLLLLGGDNSITYPAMAGVFGERLSDAGLITIDAHHDLRDGASNGSPVRQLLEAGLPGERIVQIGIADFANSAAYAARAHEHGITVIPRDELRAGAVERVVARALEIAGGDGRPIYVDLDVDVCDRSVAPACPAAAPGGIGADELRSISYLLARDPRVRAVDITEIDAANDAPDGRTVRLAALLVLECAAGLFERTNGPDGRRA